MITGTKHPSFYLEPHLVNAIRQAAPEAERTGKLTVDQLTLIYEQGWFKLLIPKAYGGLQCPLPQLLRLEESLSWANGSLGWVVTLCCGAGWFGGFLNPDLAKTLIDTPEICLAGSGAPTGTATVSSGGYVINGQWKYASGAHHATHFTANCVIKDEIGVVFNEDGTPLILPFIFDRKDVQLLPAWKYTGMVATGSDAFEVKNLLVEINRCFKISPEAAVINELLYRYPFLQLAETTLAANLSGMAIHFMDLCEPIFADRIQYRSLSEKQVALLNSTLDGCKALLNNARQSFYQIAHTSWQSGFEINDAILKEVSGTSRILAKTAIQVVDTLYPYCGLTAAHTESEINRVWRDLHTASQHSLLTFPAE